MFQRLEQYGTQTTRSIVLLLLGMSFIPLNDALIKIMSERLPLAEIVAVRAIISLLIVILFMRGWRSIVALDMKSIILFTLRGMCLVVAMYLYFLGLASLPISIVVSIFFLSPIMITLLSAIILKEKIGTHRISAIIISVIGVLVIMRPGTASYQIEMFFALGAAISYALFQVMTRSLKSVGDLPALITIQHFCYLISSFPLLFFNIFGNWQVSDNQSIDFLLRSTRALSFTECLYLTICALTVLFLSISSSYAYRNSEASLVAPFEYVAIPVSVIWGIYIWGEWPELLSWLGMLLIFLGGVYAVYREHIQKQHISSHIPMPVSTGMALHTDNNNAP